ncbi:MAG: type II toxin-antitoxin system RelE/ParE family toxin [Rubrivivax sp.]|nr:type II toxin-antitoxin system RelE/ParE family toxin [Rubrivivax sp.]
MATRTATVRFTANFEHNLAQIGTYWAERDAPQVYVRLLDELGSVIIGNLERHPRIGRRFFARTPQSVEARERVAGLMKRFGAADVREYLSGDYLLLYVVVAANAADRTPEVVHLLSIKHHRQLSFDFEGFWQAHHGDAA